MTNPRVNVLLAVSAITGLMLNSNLVSPAPAFAAATGKESVEKLVAIFKGWDANSASAKVFADAAGFIDYDSMSEQALGAAQWVKLKPAERADFTTALRKLVEERYYPRWHKLFSKGTLTYGKESSAHGDIILDTTLKVNQKSQDVSWQLDNKGAQPKVISLRVDDKDLLSRLHERISPRLQKSGFKALLSWLQNKAAKETDSN
jgi:ABC-type transporter MlaC component